MDICSQLHFKIQAQNYLCLPPNYFTVLGRGAKNAALSPFVMYVCDLIRDKNESTVFVGYCINLRVINFFEKFVHFIQNSIKYLLKIK